MPDPFGYPAGDGWWLARDRRARPPDEPATVRARQARPDWFDEQAAEAADAGCECSVEPRVFRRVLDPEDSTQRLRQYECLVCSTRWCATEVREDG